ncbi:hypothetical protein [Pseudomonas putida]|nr:hypothetical protein [Pseudomonas putida]
MESDQLRDENIKRRYARVPPAGAAEGCDLLILIRVNMTSFLSE